MSGGAEHAPRKRFDIGYQIDMAVGCAAIVPRRASDLTCICSLHFEHDRFAGPADPAFDRAWRAVADLTRFFIELTKRSWSFTVLIHGSIFHAVRIAVYYL